MEGFARLVSHAHRRVQDVLLVLGLTGLRPTNAFRLTWDEVDGDVVRIPPEEVKNGRWAVIPISSYIGYLLARRRMELPSPNGWAFPSRLDHMRPTESIRTAWKRVSRDAGLDWMRPYDLRHFFASQLAKQGATEQQIGRLLGLLPENWASYDESHGR